MATVEENDRVGIYRLSLTAGGDKDSGAPQLYAVNSPFFESRLDEIGAAELAGKLKPIRTEVLDFEHSKTAANASTWRCRCWQCCW